MNFNKYHKSLVFYSLYIVLFNVLTINKSFAFECYKNKKEKMQLTIDNNIYYLWGNKETPVRFKKDKTMNIEKIDSTSEYEKYKIIHSKNIIKIRKNKNTYIFRKEKNKSNNNIGYHIFSFEKNVYSYIKKQDEAVLEKIKSDFFIISNYYKKIPERYVSLYLASISKQNIEEVFNYIKNNEITSNEYDLCKIIEEIYSYEPGTDIQLTKKIIQICPKNIYAYMSFFDLMSENNNEENSKNVEKTIENGISINKNDQEKLCILKTIYSLNKLLELMYVKREKITNIEMYKELINFLKYYNTTKGIIYEWNGIDVRIVEAMLLEHIKNEKIYDIDAFKEFEIYLDDKKNKTFKTNSNINTLESYLYYFKYLQKNKKDGLSDKYIEKAYKADNKNDIIAIEYARFLHKNKKYNEAVEVLKKDFFSKNEKISNELLRSQLVETIINKIENMEIPKGEIKEVWDIGMLIQ